MNSTRRSMTAAIAASALLLSGLVTATSASAATQPDPGPTTTVSGTLQRAVADVRGSVTAPDRPGLSALKKRKSSEQVQEWARVLTRDGQSITLDPDSKALDKIENGAQVQLTVDGTAVKTDKPAAVREAVVTPQKTAPTNVEQNAYVVVVEDSETTGGHSPARAKELTQQAADYWVNEAQGKISNFNVSDAKTLETTNSCSVSPFDLWDEAAALYPDVDFVAYSGNHLVVYLPKSCADESEYVGVATLGVGIQDGGLLTVVYDWVQVAAHELGHNFGLGHANLEIQFDGWQMLDEYIGGYGPQTLAMGSQYDPGALDLGYQDFLGLAPQSAVKKLTDSSTKPTKITSLTGTGDAPRGVTFTDPTNGQTFYVEYRNAQGRDAKAAYADPWMRYFAYSDVEYGPGVRLYRVDRAGNSYTLAACLPSAWCSTYIEPGQTFQPEFNGFAITVGEVTETTAEVSIEFVKTSTTTEMQVSDTKFGQRGTVAVAVYTDDDYSGELPEGKVTIYDGKKKLGTAELNGGNALFTLPANLKVGDHLIQAHFLGGSTYADSTATAFLNVAKGTAKAKVVKATKVKQGKRAKVTVEVSGVAKTPATGKVKLKVGSKNVSKAVKLKKTKSGSYRAVVTTSKLPKGKLKLVYSGDKTYKKATYSTKLNAK